MKNYRLFSLVALVVLALAGGAASLVVADGPVEAAPHNDVVAATAVSAETSVACPQEGADGPCQPCTPEECAARCGVDLKTAQECQRSAKCQTGANCAAAGNCKMTAAKAGQCSQGTGHASHSL